MEFSKTLENGDRLPTSWVWSTIGDVCLDPQYGWTTSASTKGKVRLLRTTDITQNLIDWDAVPFCKEMPDNIEKYILKEGDIVISRAGSVGFSKLITNPVNVIFASYLIRFTPLIDNKYLALFLQSPSYWKSISEKKLGIAVPNVNASKLKQITIPVAPLNEQKNIVVKIEELFTKLEAGIEALKRAKGQLKRYRQSVLRHAFEGKLTEERRNQKRIALSNLSHSIGRATRRTSFNRAILIPESWKYGELRDYCDLISGQHIKEEDYNRNGKGIPYLTGPADFTRMYPTITRWTEMPKIVAKENDVLITVKGAGVGKTNILNIEEAAISRQLMAIRSSYLIPMFIYYYVLYNFYLFQKMGAGSTVPGIDRESILSTSIPVPPKDEQQMITEAIESIFSIADNTENVILQNLELATAFRGSILNLAFSGNLVPQNTDDETAAVLIQKIRTEQIMAQTSNDSKVLKKTKVNDRSQRRLV